MNEISLLKAADLLEKVRTVRPLVHHITNYVTAKSCAAMALACGASPVMAEDADEMLDVAKRADALLLNLGTISKAKYSAMIIAQKMANKRGIPVLFDPVGVGGISVRHVMAKELLQGGVSSVRGNYAEISALGGNPSVQAGVDCTDAAIDLPKMKRIASFYGCVVAATGETDYISDGARIYSIKNGHKLFTFITGAGCMTTTLAAAFCAAGPEDPLLANVAALLCMGVAGEIAARKAVGPGSFEPALFDAVYKMSANDILQKGKLEALS